WQPGDASPIAAVLTVRGAEISRLLADIGANQPISGTAGAALNLKGTWGLPQGNVLLRASNVIAYDEKFSSVRADLLYSGHTVDLVNSEIASAAGRITASGSYSHADSDWQTGQLKFNLAGNGLALAAVNHFSSISKDLAGEVDLKVNGTARLVK